MRQFQGGGILLIVLFAILLVSSLVLSYTVIVNVDIKRTSQVIKEQKLRLLASNIAILANATLKESAFPKNGLLILDTTRLQSPNLIIQAVLSDEQSKTNIYPQLATFSQKINLTLKKFMTQPCRLLFAIQQGIPGINKAFYTSLPSAMATPLQRSPTNTNIRSKYYLLKITIKEAKYVLLEQRLIYYDMKDTQSPKLVCRFQK